MTRYFTDDFTDFKTTGANSTLASVFLKKKNERQAANLLAHIDKQDGTGTKRNSLYAFDALRTEHGFCG